MHGEKTERRVIKTFCVMGRSLGACRKIPNLA